MSSGLIFEKSDCKAAHSRMKASRISQNSALWWFDIVNESRADFWEIHLQSCALDAQSKPICKEALQKSEHCNTIQLTATHCNTRQHIAAHLQHTLSVAQSLFSKVSSLLNAVYGVGCLSLVASLKSYVSAADYRLFCRALLQKRPMFLGSLLIIASP